MDDPAQEGMSLELVYIVVLREDEAMKWDVFISHATEDKAAVVRPLADILAAHSVKSWVDEAELTLGDSLREKIDEGLKHSQFGVVILSPSFFAKRWPKRELDGLFARESDADANKVILPVWHNVTPELVRGYSPILAGLLAARTDEGMAKVAQKIIDTIRSVGRVRRTASPIFSGKLTKKALLNFPLGSVLITNTINPDDRTPLLVEELGVPSSRESLWKRLRDASISNTTVLVFENIAHYRTHMESRNDWLPDDLRCS
jgi:hypothetical protein